MVRKFKNASMQLHGNVQCLIVYFDYTLHNCNACMLNREEKIECKK